MVKAEAEDHACRGRLSQADSELSLVSAKRTFRQDRCTKMFPLLDSELKLKGCDINRVSQKSPTSSANGSALLRQTHESVVSNYLVLVRARLAL